MMSDLSPLQLFRDGDLSHSIALFDLANRMNLWPKLYRRYVEEILSIVPLADEFISKSINDEIGELSLDDYLQKKNWSKSDLVAFVSLPEALRLFSEYHFSPSLEEEFLSSQGCHDQIIYSALRVQSPFLVRELWIRLEEGKPLFLSSLLPMVKVQRLQSSVLWVHYLLGILNRFS